MNTVTRKKKEKPVNRSGILINWSLKKQRSSARGVLGYLAAGALFLGTISGSRAADWYLHADLATDWNTPANWWSSPVGPTGTHPAAINSSDNFYNNGCVLRTPGAVPTTFGGASLTLRGGTIAVKTSSSTQPTTIGNLISYGGSIGNWTGNIQLVHITNFTNHVNTTIGSGGSTRGINLTVGNLQGIGDLTLNGDGTLLVTLNSAANFYGTLYTSGTTAITFQNAFVSGGALVVPGGIALTLNATVTFSGLVVNGVEKAPGTYPSASLGFSGPGSIVVRAPLPWHLHSNQSGNNWTILTDWWSAVSGGSNPLAISSNDDYYTNNRILRTPNSASVFGGATLNINGTTAGRLVVKNSATIQNLNTAGTTAGFSNGSGNNQILNVANFYNGAANTNFDCAAANRGFNVDITTLSGTGNLTLLGYGGGQLLLGVANANAYTGTLAMSATSTGTLTFQKPLFSAGSFVVGAGNNVVVNHPVSFAGLTVGGVAKAAGTYTAASLGFTGPGTVTVTNRPPHMFGVNVSGMEGSYYIVPGDSSLAYYASKGLTLVRVPFKWERLQPALYGPLNAAKLADVDTVLARAASHGQMVILDMHNYGEYNGKLIGSAEVPYAAYQDVWTKLAAHFAASPHASSIYAYDIMNEPHASATAQDWPLVAQYGINGVRAGDSTRFIMVEGRSWSSAQNWPKSNAGLANIVDPQKKLMFSAHCYFGTNHNDQYLSYDAEHAYPNMGVDQVAPFVEWCKQNKVYGHIGEYGVPASDPRWNPVLQNFLQYLDDNDISGTYWGGGFGSNYPLSIEPTPADRPQMAVLEQFGQ